MTFDYVAKEGDAPDQVTNTVTWRSPRSAGVEILVFGVTECLLGQADDATDGGPCIAEDTPLPVSVRELLARAPAADGIVSWTRTDPEGLGSSDLARGPDGTGYAAIVVAASGTSGESSLTIADPGSIFVPSCPEGADCVY